MIKIASKIYFWLLRINGYNCETMHRDGAECVAITTDQRVLVVKHVGNISGYWIDKATGMPVVPVWFK